MTAPTLFPGTPTAQPGLEDRPLGSTPFCNPCLRSTCKISRRWILAPSEGAEERQALPRLGYEPIQDRRHDTRLEEGCNISYPLSPQLCTASLAAKPIGSCATVFLVRVQCPLQDSVYIEELPTAGQSGKTPNIDDVTWINKFPDALSTGLSTGLARNRRTFPT